MIDRAGSRVERLTPRQLEVLRMIAHGRTDREIAERLGITVNTVRAHREDILMRLHLHSMPSAVWLATKVGAL
jgi:DNA-binding NarL/FixJ family response regulator